MQYPSNWKQCATCEYWAGERQITDNWGRYVNVDSPMTHGRCMNRHSGWFYSDLGKQVNSSCPSYEKWGVLDKMK